MLGQEVLLLPECAYDTQADDCLTEVTEDRTLAYALQSIQLSCGFHVYPLHGPGYSHEANDWDEYINGAGVDIKECIAE